MAADPSMFAHVAIDEVASASDQEALKAEVVEKCGGLPDILSGYFGTLLPCVIVKGKVLTSEGGDSLHFWLQGAIEPPFEMDDELGIVGCKGLDERTQQIITRAQSQL